METLCRRISLSTDRSHEPRQHGIDCKPTARIFIRQYQMAPTRCTLLLLSLVAPFAHALNSLVYGPGSLEMKLLITKLAAASPGCTSSFYVGEDEKGAQKCRGLMYGKEYASANVDAEGNGKVLTTIEQLGAGLKAAEALAIVCDTEPLPENIASTLMNEAGDKLSRVVLVSRMGITRAKPAGPFGFGGGDAALQATEKTLAEVTKANGVGLSIIRVGTLKGGGPGNEAVGLSKAYDDGIGDLGTFMVSSAYDKYTIGAKLTKGDPFDFANPIVKAGRGSSFEPFDDETSRVVAAQAAVKAMSLPEPVEVSVSSAKSEQLPTDEEWAELFGAL